MVDIYITIWVQLSYHQSFVKKSNCSLDCDWTHAFTIFL